jgi:hypothetical protein
MDATTLEQKASDIHKAAIHPGLQDILYPDSIRAEWNARFNTFDAVSIRGMKHNRQVPSASERFTIRFLSGDPTDEVSVRTRVAKRMAELGKTKKSMPRYKRA